MCSREEKLVKREGRRVEDLLKKCQDLELLEIAVERFDFFVQKLSEKEEDVGEFESMYERFRSQLDGLIMEKRVSVEKRKDEKEWIKKLNELPNHDGKVESFVVFRKRIELLMDKSESQEEDKLIVLSKLVFSKDELMVLTCKSLEEAKQKLDDKYCSELVLRQWMMSQLANVSVRDLCDVKGLQEVKEKASRIYRTIKEVKGVDLEKELFVAIYKCLSFDIGLKLVQYTRGKLIMDNVEEWLAEQINVAVAVELASGSGERGVSRTFGRALATRHTCFSCGRQGHISRDCGRCFVCGRKGHKAVNCPQRWRDDSSSWRSNWKGKSSQADCARNVQKKRDVEGCWRVDSSATNRIGPVQVEKVEPVMARALTATGSVKVTSVEGRNVPKDVACGSSCGKAKADLVDKRRVKLVTKGRSEEEDSVAVCKAASVLQCRLNGGESSQSGRWRNSNNAESDDLIQKGGCHVDHVIRKQTSTSKKNEGINKIRFQDGGECSNWNS